MPPSTATEPADLAGPDSDGTVAHGVPVADTVAALDAMGISDNWVVAKRLRAAHKRGETHLDLGSTRRNQYNFRFRNLVIGCIGEELFMRQCLDPLKSHGFDIVDERDAHNQRDFVIVQGKHALPINVKVSGTRFTEAKQLAGLDPDDCVPFSCKNVLAAADQRKGTEPDLVFVQLVEYGLRQRVDAYMSRISGNEGILWQLLSSHSGDGVESAQDEYVQNLFSSGSLHRDNLLALSNGPRGFKALSAQDLVKVIDNHKERIPQLFNRGMGGNPLVHVSASKEMLPWGKLSSQLRTVGVAGVVRQVRRSGISPADLSAKTKGRDLAA